MHWKKIGKVGGYTVKVGEADQYTKDFFSEVSLYIDHAVPFKCPKCGNMIFRSEMVKVGEPSTINLFGQKVPMQQYACPKCGHTE